MCPRSLAWIGHEVADLKTRVQKTFSFQKRKGLTKENKISILRAFLLEKERLYPKKTRFAAGAPSLSLLIVYNLCL